MKNNGSPKHMEELFGSIAYRKKTTSGGMSISIRVCDSQRVRRHSKSDRWWGSGACKQSALETIPAVLVHIFAIVAHVCWSSKATKAETWIFY